MKAKKTKAPKKGKKVWLIVPFSKDDPRLRVEELGGVTKKVVKGNTYWFKDRVQITNPIAESEDEAELLRLNLMEIRLKSLRANIKAAKKAEKSLVEACIDTQERLKKLAKG